MVKRLSWVMSIVLVAAAFGGHAEAKSPQKPVVKTKPANSTPAAAEASSEANLDLSLRTKAAAMPTKAADGSVMDTPASHMVLVDYDTGLVLAEKAADQKMYPSSMTKIMTLYIVFERLKQGALNLDNQFTISEKAWRMQGSKMFVPIGSQIGLEDLIRGISIQSGNDACVAVAEGIAGSEDAFAKQMNDTAKKLGMEHTNFTDSSGWPHPDNTTTPIDLARLGAALIRDFPQYYHYLSEREFTFHNIRQFNRNLLLGNASLNVDGIKTGHTEAAGYGITLSAKETATNRRLVLVVNGLDSEAARAQEGERLLKWGFTNFYNAKAFTANLPVDKIKAKVWMSATREISLAVANDIRITLPKTGASKVKAEVTYNSPLIAPVTKGAEVGKLTITFADGSAKQFPVIAAEDAPKRGFFGRMTHPFGL